MDDRDHERERQREQAEDGREHDVERAELEVDPAVRRVGREPDVAADERVLERLRRRLHTDRW